MIKCLTNIIVASIKMKSDQAADITYIISDSAYQELCQADYCDLLSFHI